MTRRISYALFDSPLGTLLLAHSGRGLCSIRFPAISETHLLSNLRSLLQRRFGTVELVPESSPLKEAISYLKDYFSGPATAGVFGGRLDPGGTDFQRLVWKTLLEIPAGQTLSYQDVARKLGRASACRAVGAACGANPIPIIVPCHRVVSSSGALGGFGGGLKLKRYLLQLEGWNADG